MLHLVPVPLLIATTALLIRAELKGNRKQIYLWKPISTALVLVVCTLSFLRPNVEHTFTWLVLLGLLFSLLGDAALMIEADWAFLAGVGAFALAQLTYGLTFRALGGFGPYAIPVAVAVILIDVAFIAYLYRSLGHMRVPIILYALLIAFMVWSAFATRYDGHFSPQQGNLLAAGALLFYVSDLTLAANKFKRPFGASPLLILSAYYTGQLLIALSASYA